MSQSNWVTIAKAGAETGLPESFFNERTGLSGIWPEGPVWKWFEGRKLINMNGFYSLVDKTPSVRSNRGRKKAKTCQEQ